MEKRLDIDAWVKTLCVRGKAIFEVYRIRSECALKQLRHDALLKKEPSLMSDEELVYKAKVLAKEKFEKFEHYTPYKG